MHTCPLYRSRKGRDIVFRCSLAPSSPFGTHSGAKHFTGRFLAEDLSLECALKANERNSEISCHMEYIFRYTDEELGPTGR